MAGGASVAGWEAMSDPSESYINGSAGAAALQGKGPKSGGGSSGWNPVSTFLDLLNIHPGGKTLPAAPPQSQTLPIQNVGGGSANSQMLSDVISGLGSIGL